MAILQECPDCHAKQSLRNKKCKCGEDLDKAKKSKRVKYWIKYRTPSGIQKKEYISKSIDEAKATDAKIKAAKQENRFLDIMPESKITFLELTGWYKELKKVQALKTYKRVLEAINNFNQYFGETYVYNIEQSDIENYQMTRLEIGISKSTIDKEVSIVQTMVKKAFYNDKVPGRILKSFQRTTRLMKKNENKRDRILSPSEFKSIMEYLPKHQKAIFATGYYTGMRLNEILSMTWDRTDLRNGFFKLEAQHTKDEEPRIVPINETLLELLKKIPEVSDFVFTYKKKPISDIRTGLKDACKTAGVKYGRAMKKGFTFHDLRHTFNTNMRKAGVPESVIMEITGHATREMFDRYNTVDQNDLRDASERMFHFLKMKF